MKEDYLWDKTGGDFDIEQLENALQAFRYQEIAPPELPAQIIPFEVKPPRRFLRLTFAFASFAAIVIVCSVIWLQVSNGEVEPVSDLAKTITPPVNVDVTKNSDINSEMPQQKNVVVVPVDRTAVVPTAVSDASRFRVKKDLEVTVKKDSKAANARRTCDGSRDDCGTEIKKPPVKLTKEETYAYNQLMLALSITSSKLKIVTDKLEGIEEQNAVRVNER